VDKEMGGREGAGSEKLRCFTKTTLNKLKIIYLINLLEFPELIKSVQD